MLILRLMKLRQAVYLRLLLKHPFSSSSNLRSILFVNEGRDIGVYKLSTVIFERYYNSISQQQKLTTLNFKFYNEMD